MTMLKNQTIICFAPSDWWGMNPSCTTHIMKRLAVSNKILYVNPFSSDLLGVTKARRKGFAQRLWRKCRSLAKWLKKADDNLYIFSPVFVPVQGKKMCDVLNNRILAWQIKTACRIAGMKDPLLWIENVRAADLLDHFKNSTKIYHVSDLFCHDDYISNQTAQKNREKRISQTADVIICVSKELFTLKKQDHPNVHYLPHGVDFEAYQHAADDGHIPEEVQHIPHPIAGYFGTLTGSNDIALWEHCAANLPDVSFVLAGRVTGGDYSRLLAMKNVYMPGFIPYEKIPALCAAFDVCMLNWKMSPWIRSCNPLKMFEYMASGRPIVSVAIQEIEQYNELISMAADREEFCRLLRWELTHDTPQRSRQRIEIARQHDWRRKISALSEIIEQTLKKSEDYDRRD